MFEDIKAAINETNFEHAGYAAVMMAAVGLLTGNWLAGALFGFAFFLGREHAQAQKAYGLGDFQAFDLRKWDWDARLDLIFPAISVIVMYVALAVWR